MATGYTAAPWTQLPPGWTQNPDGSLTAPNGHQTLPGVTINPDGTVSGPNGNPGGTITFNPDGSTASQTQAGITTVYGADGKPTGNFKADGTPASANEIQEANNKANGPDPVFGGGRFLGAPNLVSGNANFDPGAPFRAVSGAAIDGARAVGKGAKTIVDAVGNVIGGGGGSLGSVNTGAISDAAAAAKALSDQYSAERGAYVNGGPTNLSPAQIAAYQAAEAPQIAAYQAATAPGAITAGQASGSGASGGHSVAAVAAPSVKAELAKYDTQYELAARANQDKLVEGLQGAIDGKDPSVAAIQLRQSTDRNIANQYALAASARGMDTGLAQRQAMLGASDLNAKAAADASILRAQEITAARAQMGDVLGTQRAGDIQVAGTTFGAEQGVNNDFAGAQNTRSNLNATLENQTGIANAGNDTSASIASANNATNASIASANNLTSANVNTAQIQSEIARANALNQTNQNVSQAQIQAQIAMANAKTQAERDLAQAQLNQANQQFNVTSTQSQQQIDQQARDALAKNALSGAATNVTGTVGAANAQAELAKAQAAKNASLVGAGGSILATLLK